MKWWMLLFCLLSAPLSAQRWMHGVLLGGGVGFTHNLEVNPACDEYGREGFIYDDTFDYTLYLGYRFRFILPRNERIFFDTDVTFRYNKLGVHRYYYSEFESEMIAFKKVLRNGHGQFTLPLSVNYRLVKGLYAGIGVEPVWDISTYSPDDMPFFCMQFDLPVHVKVGYTISKRVDIALVYRYGFFNTINRSNKIASNYDNRAYLDGNLSDLSLSIFVPFVAK